MHSAGLALPVEVASARVVETEVDGTVVATVGLRTPLATGHGTGPNPIVAAAHACFDAVTHIGAVGATD